MHSESKLIERLMDRDEMKIEAGGPPTFGKLFIEFRQRYEPEDR